jgi:hypothetical protein
MKSHPILVLLIIALLAGSAAEARYSGGTGEPVSVRQVEKVSDAISQNRGLELYSGYYQKNDGQVEVYYDSIENGRLVGGKTVLALPPVLEYQSIIQAPPSWNYYTVINNGPSGNRIDIVVVGDGYTQSELANYQIHVNNILSGYFAQEPLASYINFFNVHRVDVISNESGVDEPDYNIYRDTALDMTYNCGGTARLLCVNTAKAWDAASVAPDADQILALANSTRYGGAGYSDLATMAGDNYWSVELALHEFGHSFGKLADEYDYGGSETYTGSEPSQINISIYNDQQQTNLQTKWFRWLDLLNVDTYEGAYYCKYGIYRPTDNSKMRSLNRPFEEVNVEQFILRIYENVSIIDDSTPLSDDPISCYTVFYVVPVEPTPNTINIQWYIDAQPVSGANAKTFSTDIPALSRGLHEVSVTVTDNTSKVRDEIKRAQLMTKSLRWQIWVGVKYSGGTGEPNNPYRIASAEDLNDIGNYQEDWDKHFILTNDVNLAEYTGKQFNIIGSFTGVFDGNNHKVWSFTWSSIDSNGIGLFGCIGAGGQIKNLALQNVDVNAVSGWSVGGLAGINSGTITNCYVTGSVSGYACVGGLVGGYDDGTIIDCHLTGTVSGYACVGGLVGSNATGTILKCYATGTFTGEFGIGGLVGAAGTILSGGLISCSFASGTVAGNRGIGGLVGELQGGEILDCYATVDVDGNDWTGGLIGGICDTAISYCYSSGRVSGDANNGGLVGYEYCAGSYLGCFWDSEVNPDVNGIGDTSDPNVIGKPTAEMKAKSTFTEAGWDFVEIWGIGENQTYPFLLTDPAGDLNHDKKVDLIDLAILALHWLEGGL